MGKFSSEKEVVSEKWEPTLEDVRLLREELKSFTGNNPFEELMIHKNIVKYHDKELFVLDANAYTANLKTNAYRGSLDYYERERLFDSYPEEREKFLTLFREFNHVKAIPKV